MALFSVAFYSCLIPQTICMFRDGSVLRASQAHKYVLHISSQIPFTLMLNVIYKCLPRVFQPLFSHTQDISKCLNQ